MIRRISLFTLCMTVALACGLSGCGGGDDAKKPAPVTPVVKEDAAKPSKADTADKDKAKPDADSAAAPEGWGTIKGQIVWTGDIPEPVILVKQGDQNAKDAATCAAVDVMKEEVVVNKDNKGLKWVLVYIGGRPNIHPDLKEPEGTAEIGQKNCHFIPHVGAMRQGQKFIITSDDPVAHNTKGDGFKNPGFNPVVPPAPQGGRSQLDGPDLVAENLPISISCSIHPWMKAYWAVFAHPYFAVTDDDGRFEIKYVPAGTQKLMVWHELGFNEGSNKGQDIEVKADETTDLGEIKYTAPKK